MKTLILSDIHSNIHALEAIWQRESDCDLVYCAGDLVDYGPYPEEVINWIRVNQVPCVQGNHDAWVALCYRRGHTLATIPPEEQAWVHHNAGTLEEEDITFLETLPKAVTCEIDGIQYGITHMYQDYDEIVSLHAFQEFREQIFDRKPIDNLILGHTHRQAIRYLSDSIKWINPGSVSYRRPDDPDKSAHYATITDGKISLHRLEYDLAPASMAVRQVKLKDSEMLAADFIFGINKKVR